ncbi:hypothetical protein [Aquimarina aquimarini]|uniref:hypothetical protein n=1 Tax=Aquimarina aquimarini TaxID=1191734 RepID=UPI000D55CA99|nr:hypothetical protein [Aquimarina aquimarini]
MKPYIASLLNALVLISLGAWSYFSSESPSITALIPVIIGVILLFLNKGIKKENKVIAHIAVLLTLVILIGLYKPFMGAIHRESTIGVVRVSIMILFTLIAFLSFIKSFINARKSKS